MFNFSVAKPLLHCSLSIPFPPDALSKKKKSVYIDTHMLTVIFVMGGVGLWVSTHPYSPSRGTFMASSATRIHQKSFQARIYLPVCISTRRGVFLLLRKGVRQGGGRILSFRWKASCSSSGSLPLPQQREHFQDSWVVTAGREIYSFPHYIKTIVLQTACPLLRAVPRQSRLRGGKLPPKSGS